MRHRRDFLLAGCGLAAGAALWPAVAGHAAESSPLTRPKLVADDGGETVWVVAGVLMTVKLRAEDTGGAYSVFHDFVLPGAGPGLHTHTREDESMFVLEGQVRATLGDRTFDVATGTLIHMPRGVPHGFKNVTDRPARLLMTYTPGGFDKFHLEFGKPAKQSDRNPPTFTAEEKRSARAAAARYGLVSHEK
jgi:quercetin dioxygenase-like cupin family protein